MCGMAALFHLGKIRVPDQSGALDGGLAYSLLWGGVYVVATLGYYALLRTMATCTSTIHSVELTVTCVVLCVYVQHGKTFMGTRDRMQTVATAGLLGGGIAILSTAVPATAVCVVLGVLYFGYQSLLPEDTKDRHVATKAAGSPWQGTKDMDGEGHVPLANVYKPRSSEKKIWNGEATEDDRARQHYNPGYNSKRRSPNPTSSTHSEDQAHLYAPVSPAPEDPFKQSPTDTKQTPTDPLDAAFEARHQTETLQREPMVTQSPLKKAPLEDPLAASACFQPASPDPLSASASEFEFQMLKEEAKQILALADKQKKKGGNISK